MLRIFLTIMLLMAPLSGWAQEEKSFSKQMNELKRSGDYVYAESSAPNEADAKTACDALLKIEITKYLSESGSQSAAETRIVKDISEYNREYLVQPRGDMFRVFGYVAKKDIVAGKAESKPSEPVKETKEQEKSETAAEEETPPTEVTANVFIGNPPVETEEKAAAEETKATVAEETQVSVESPTLNVGGTSLAKWQTEMLQNILKETDMLQAKKLLNRYKSQNRIKRLGDRDAANPRPYDTFYLIFDEAGHPTALLTPSDSSEHYDLISGTTVNLNSFASNPYYWFQISN